MLKIFQKFIGKLPCWSLILVKLQNCISDVFQRIFRKISELLFYRTTANCYFRTKKGRCKYWSPIVRVRNFFRKGKVQIFLERKKGVTFAFKFLLEVSFCINFGDLCLKNTFDQEKTMIRCSQIIKSNKVKFFNKIWLKGFSSFQYFRLNVMKIQFFFVASVALVTDGS